jgi:hypothetical protein
VNIPDPNFKNALVSSIVVDLNCNGVPDIVVDTNGDGEIQLSEAEAVPCLIIPSFNISSLEGISSFSNLLQLNCINNNLTTLDLSQNVLLEELDAAQNPLLNLNFSANVNLNYLKLSSNVLTDLVLGEGLETLYLNPVHALTELDLTVCPNLRFFTLRSNSVTFLDFSNCPLIWVINARDGALTEIVLSENSLLTGIWVDGNQLTSIDVSDCIALEGVKFDFNNFEYLDLSNNPNLTYVTMGWNDDLIIANMNNGNNEAVDYFAAFVCPNMFCIQVDSIEIVENNGWWKTPVTIWSEVPCESLEVEETNQEPQFIVVPGIADDGIMVYTDYAIDSIRIIDIHGRTVLNGNDTNDSYFDVSVLTSGIYFVEIVSNSKQAVQRFIKR